MPRSRFTTNSYKELMEVAPANANTKRETPSSHLQTKTLHLTHCTEDHMGVTFSSLPSDQVASS